jgi:hypothetical protein
LNRLFLVLGCLLAASTLSVAQAAPATTAPPTWDLLLGGTFQRGIGSTTMANHYGWEISGSEYPYKAHPWIGATVEGSGSYWESTSTVSGVSTQVDDGLSTLMFGPSVAFNHRHARPFARFLFGGVFDRTSVSVGGQSATPVTSKNYGIAAGGGLDFPVRRSIAIRTQADWVKFWLPNLQSPNTVRTSVGVVFRF